MKQVKLILGMVVLLGLVLSTSQQGAVFAQGQNLLNNPSFEEPYVNGAASGWGRWHEDSGEKKDCNSERYVVEPKWSPEFNPDLILDGARSMHVGNQFDTWRGGVIQDVDSVTAGTTYKASVSAWARGSNDQYPAASDGSVNLRVRIGIDPTGSGLWSSGSVVWSPAVSPRDSWQTTSVEATAQGNKVTVIVEADLSGVGNCRAHLDAWFDKAELVAVNSAPPPTNTPAPQPVQPVQPPPPPPATATPIPTETPVPTETPIPSPTATATPAGGTVCINAFGDGNANGQNDADEGYMAGVRFTIVSSDGEVFEGVSSGTDRAVCFEGLSAGTYQVAQSVPSSLEMTTAANASVNVEVGSNITLEFGSRAKSISGEPEAPTAEDAAEEIADAGGGEEVAENTDSATAGDVDEAAAEESAGAAGLGSLGLIELLGICVMGIAVLLLGAVVFLLYRQQQRPA